jgi:hypothetical protein
MSAPTDPFDTIGLRLRDQARAIATRHLPDLTWTSPLAVLLDHITAPSARFEGRFDRMEAAPGSEFRPRMSVVPLTSAGRPLPSDVSQRLRAVVGPGADAMRVHDDEVADATAAAHRADAVTVGSDVYFRRGRLRPRDPAGFGLLVHEATHVLERLRPGVSWRRSTAAGIRDEESAALSREAAGRTPYGRPVRQNGLPGTDRWPHGATPSAVPPGSAVPLGPGPPARQATTAAHPATAAHPTVAARPMAAAADRDVTSPPPAASFDLEALRNSLVPELMRRLRDEFERGG